MKKPILLGIVFILFAGVIGGFAYFEYVMKPEIIKKAILGQPRSTSSVVTEVAGAEAWRRAVPAIGTLSAVQGIDVAPETAGIIEKLGFESGQDVEAGTLLVELDDGTEQASLKSAQAQLRNSQVSLTRQRELLDRGNTSRSNFDTAVAARDSDAAELERIQALIAEKSILAPFSGKLGIRQVDIGQYVSAGTVLVSLQQLDPIYVDFPIPEQQLDQVAVGDDVEVLVDAFPKGKFTGKVTVIDAQVNQSTRNILVRAQLANPDKQLLPGMFANVRALAPQPQQVVTILRTAVTYSLFGDTVFVAKPDAAKSDKPGEATASGAAAAKPAAETFTLEQRRVTLGEQRGDLISVLDGVKAGERVVTGGQNKIFNGQKVTLSKVQPLKAPSDRPQP